MNAARIYCLVPAKLASRLERPLRRHFQDEPHVEVLVERRLCERRKTASRRAAPAGDAAYAVDRRRIKSPNGRRVGERRATQVPVEPDLVLPRRALRNAAGLSFVEAIEASPEHREDLDTARLITSFQAGDTQAFSALYERYFDRTYTYLRVALDDAHEAEDAAQQVFIQVLEALCGYEVRPGTPFRAWLFRIVRNYSINHNAKHGRVDLEEPQAIGRRRAQHRADDDQYLSVLDWLSDEDLVRLVECLPHAQRQVLMLRYMMGLSCPEVAQVMERSPDAVRQLQQRAMTFLRGRLTALGRAPARTCSRSPMLGRLQQANVLRARRFVLLG